MKILNLYCGIGGNRKLWPDGHEITAVELNPQIAEIYQEFFPTDKVIVGDAHEYLLKHYKEFDFIWSSVPCQSHSRARFWSSSGGRYSPVYPDMKLYQEIIFLTHFAECKWVVENVKPYYEPLISYSIEIDRHLFWSNFHIALYKPDNKGRQHNNITGKSEIFGFNLANQFLTQRKDAVLRNVLNPELGLHIFDCAFNGAAQTLFQPEHFEQANLF